MASPNIEKNKENLLGALGMTLEEYNWNIEWVEKLVRDYYKGQEFREYEALKPISDCMVFLLFPKR